MSALRATFEARKTDDHPVEDALFEALCRVHTLPAEEALVTATLAASTISAFLADTARLDSRPQVSALARRELESLREDISSVLEALAEHGR